MQSGNTNHIQRNDLHKTCFQHDMADGKYNDLTKGTESDKVSRAQAFKIAISSKYDDRKKDQL